MDKRFVTFLVVAFLILTVNSLVMTWFAGDPPPPVDAPQQQAAAGGEPGENDAAANAADPDPADADPADVAAPADEPQDDDPAVADDPPAVAAQGEVEHPLTWATLGSVDPESGYRMLVIITSHGAAIERIELSGRNFRDLENTSGYLGHLALAREVDLKGVRARVVGPGTPAARAGLKPDDVIVAVGGERTPNVTAFENAVQQTEPGQSVELTIIRAGEEQKLDVELARYPLQVVRREAADPASLLMTLRGADEKELAGADGLIDGNWEIVAANDAQVTLRKQLPSGLVVTKRYGLAKVPDAERDNVMFPAYHVDFDLQIQLAEGSQPQTVAYQLDGATGLPIEGWWYANKISPHWGSAGIRDVVAGHYNGSRIAHEFMSAATIADDEEDVNPNWVPLSYIGVDAQYFAAVLIPKKKDPAVQWLASATPIRAGAVDPKNPRLLNTSFRVTSEPRQLQPGGEGLSHSFKLFAGPKKPELLGNAEYGLSELVQYGWFHWVARPMLVVLHFFYGIVGNYGLAIIMLTVMVRMAMFPLSRKQALGAQKMQQLQPEMKAIAEKYKKNPEQRMKAQQELFRKHSYNPLSGCLPLFIQMPIFIGLYRSLMVDVELRQAPLIPGLDWASNLAAPDMFLRWDTFMPGFVVHFLGPYLNILPLVTVALFLWQQKMFMPPPTDEQSALQQKMMRYMMIFMAFLFFKVASGLCLYFIASSLWGIAERKLLPKVQPAAGSATASAESKPNPQLAAKTTAGGNGAAAAKRKKQRGRR